VVYENIKENMLELIPLKGYELENGFITISRGKRA